MPAAPAPAPEPLSPLSPLTSTRLLGSYTDNQTDRVSGQARSPQELPPRTLALYIYIRYIYIYKPLRLPGKIRYKDFIINNVK